MKHLSILLVTLFTLALSAQAATAPASATQHLETLLNAIQENDIKSFHSVCNETMQTAMTPEILQRVHDQVGATIAGGYNATYWGDVTRPDDVKGYYWKLSFTTKPNHDLVAEMWVRDGKVAGFFLR